MPIKRAWIPLVALAALASAAEARSPGVKQQLRALEERVRALEEENARLRSAPQPAPAAAPAAPAEVAASPSPAPPEPAPKAVVRPAGKALETKVGGFVQVQGEVGGRADLRFPDDHDRVYVRRARVNVSGKFLEDWEWKAELELAGTIAGTSGLRAQLTDGFVAWKPRPAIGVRAGQFKTPFGFEHLWSDTKLPFVERTLGSDRLTVSRQSGLQLEGRRKDERASWSLGAFNGTPANQAGNDDERFLLAARLAGVPALFGQGRTKGQWSLGVSALRSHDASVSMAPEFEFDSTPATAAADNVFAGERAGFGLDTQLSVGPFEWWAEWLDEDYEPDSLLPADHVSARALMTQATWKLAQDRVELVARWDEFDPMREREGDITTTWTTGLQWLIRGHDLKLQANWMSTRAPKPLGDESKVLVRLQLQF